MFGFRGPQRALHLSWIAFFFSFVVWFDFAPFAGTIGHQLHLTSGQLTAIGLCNLGLTVPARWLVGALLDRFGPRRVFPCILGLAAVPNTVFAVAGDFPTLVVSRLALSVVGAGFVVGVRMVREWWPDRQLGTAEGIYAGWGNFGAGAATLGLPVLADALGGADGWRWAIGACGLLAAAWGLVFARFARDTADGSLRPAREESAALRVAGRGAVAGLVALVVPVVGVVGVVAFRLSLVHVIGTPGLAACLAVVVVLMAGQGWWVVWANRPGRPAGPGAGGRPPAPLRPVVLCCLVYAVTFGGELAVLSTFPIWFAATWHLGLATSGAAAGTFGIMNLVTRPTGGMVSDATGRRRWTLVAALAGAGASFCLLSTVDARWPVAGAVALGIVAAVFLQAGNGAVFAVVPQIDPPATGRIAGLVGAYGNLGGIVWLFLLVYVTPSTMYLAIGVAGVAVGAGVWLLLPEARSAPAHPPAVDGPGLTVPPLLGQPVPDGPGPTVRSEPGWPVPAGAQVRQP